MNKADKILRYWFQDPDFPKPAFDKWFGKDERVDKEIRDNFKEDVEKAFQGEYDFWKKKPYTSLALILLLDQFPRNIYRGTARAFAYDEKALAASLYGLDLRLDRRLPLLGRLFYYLPLEHSEDPECQERSVKLFHALVHEAPEEMIDSFQEVYGYALRHKEIIQRFSRFPHRNGILGRQPTPDEVEFLKEPWSSF